MSDKSLRYGEAGRVDDFLPLERGYAMNSFFQFSCDGRIAESSVGGGRPGRSLLGRGGARQSNSRDPLSSTSLAHSVASGLLGSSAIVRGARITS